MSGSNGDPASAGGSGQPGERGASEAGALELAAIGEPSPPRPPLTATESLKLVGGLVVVCAGLLVLMVISVVAMLLIKGTPSGVVSVATAGFGVMGTVVGAYFGLKIGADGTQSAVAGMRHEAAKAQAFAAHVPADEAEKAIALASGLAAGQEAPVARGAAVPISHTNGR